MKQYIYIIISIIFSTYSCNGQIKEKKINNITTHKKVKKMNPYQHLVTKNFEKTTENKDYKKTLSNGNYVYFTKGHYGSCYREYIKNTYYILIKSYHPNGNIQFKSLSFNQDNFDVGIAYEFDQSGKLIKEINNDEGYNFSLDDVINFCKKHEKEYDINKPIDNEIFPIGEKPRVAPNYYNNIEKKEINGVKVWSIQYNQGEIEENIIENGNIVGNARVKTYTEIILNGNTGKILSKKNIGASNEEPAKKSTSFLAEPNEKGNYVKPELGTVYKDGVIPEDTYQIYKGRTYTKAEWEEFQNSLPWWKRMI